MNLPLLTPLASIASVLTSLTGLQAQTYIVDANGGPGSHYKDLAKAVAAVPDGAVLRVRPGSYPTPFTITNKSLTIIGDDRSVVVPAAVHIGPLRSADHVRLASLTINGLLGQTGLTATNAAGEIVLHDLIVTSHNLASVSPIHILDHCARLHVSDSWFFGSTQFLDSVAQASSTHFTGTDGYPSAPPAPGLQQSGGRLQLTGCSVSGGKGLPASCQVWLVPGQDGADGIRLSNAGRLIMLGGTSFGGAGSLGVGCTGPYNGGAGIVVSWSKLLAAGTSIAGGPPGSGGKNGPPVLADASSTITNQPAALPPMITTSGTFAPGKRIQLTLTARPQSIALLLLGTQPAMQPLEPFGVGHVFTIPTLILGQYTFPQSGSMSLPLDVPTNWPLDIPAFGQLLTLEIATPPILWGSNQILLLAKS